MTWEPRVRFVMTWTMTPVAAEVELTFAELGPQLTLVGRAGMKAVVFYQSADDLAEKAPLHAGSHRARWREFAA